MHAITLDTMAPLEPSQLLAMELMRVVIWERMETQATLWIPALPIKPVTLSRTRDTLVTSHPHVRTQIMLAKGQGRPPMARVPFLMTYRTAATTEIASASRQIRTLFQPTAGQIRR
jgi:hypothetical protein